MRKTMLILLAACGSPTTAESPDAATGSPDAPVVSSTMPVIPQPTGTCPTIANGDVTFAPAGIAPRKVKLALDPAKERGELVIYWHATGSSPEEASYALGASHGGVTGAGGVIATPYSDPAAGQFEWFIVNGSPRLDDFVLADEIVACLAKAGRIDETHVHSVGMSAGGLQTTAFSFVRSDYVASVATFSGGMPENYNPVMERAENKFAALIFHGGTSDNVFGVDFKAASERYRTTLGDAGHFTAICDHGNGHNIPRDAAGSVVTFFGANGFGAWPSPYAGGLPSGFPSYCSP